jgi:hypothetical protein
LQTKRIIFYIHENDIRQEAAMSMGSISARDGIRRLLSQ